MKDVTRRTAPLYQRYSDSGAERENRAGVQAALKPGDDATTGTVTWLVQADTLHGLVPKAGNDYLRDTNGRWWVVTAAGEPVDGHYPLKCERWVKEGGSS